MISNQLNGLTQLKDSKIEIRKLLQATAKADEQEALLLAGSHLYWIITKESFQEEWCGQRKWKSISPLQYAAWAGDMPLVDKFMDLLPKEHLAVAIKQLKEVIDEGMEWGPFLLAIYLVIDAYKEHSKYFKKWTTEERDYHWVHEIGKAQLNSVVNLLQFMCSRVSLNIPDFQSPNRKSILTAKLDLGCDSPLGSTHAIFDGILSKESLEVLPQNSLYFKKASDAYLLQQFCEIRRKQLKYLIAQLEKQLLNQEDIREESSGLLKDLPRPLRIP